MIRLVACALVTAACGGGGRQNLLLSRPTGLLEVRAAHEPIYVRTETKAWRRVWLDTGAADDWAPAGTIATSADGSVRVIETDAGYAIEDQAHSRRIATDLPGSLYFGDVAMSPDGAWLAVKQERGGPVSSLPPRDIVLLAIADLSTRMIATDERDVTLAWVGDQLWYETTRQWFRIDLATATARAETELPAGLRASAQACAALGVRLDTEDHGGRRDLVIVPFASTSDPDHLATAATRILISVETDKSHWPHGGPPPKLLGDYFFAPSCHDFVFRFGDDLFVGDVASGAFSALAEATDALPAPPGQSLTAR